MNWLSVIGLLVDIAGAIFLFWSTEILNKIILAISESNQVSTSMGFSLDVGKAQAIHKSKPLKAKAHWMSRVGLWCLIIGFALQLLGTIFN